MEIKNRKVGQRFGYSHVPIHHPQFYEQLEPGIKNSVILLLSLGYKTTSSCHGHKNTPFITLDKKSTNIKAISQLESIFVSCEVKDDFILIDGNRYFIFTNSFLCNKIYQAVAKLPINTYNGDVQ